MRLKKEVCQHVLGIAVILECVCHLQHGSRDGPDLGGKGMKKRDTQKVRIGWTMLSGGETMASQKLNMLIKS